MPHRIVVIAFEGISPFHLAVPCLVFGERFDGALPAQYELTVAMAAPGRLATSSGFDLIIDHGLETFEDADTIVVPSADLSVEAAPEIIEALRLAHARGTRIVGLCLGAFTVAAAGVIDGREAVTHWRRTDELARRYPNVKVRPDMLWTDHGDVLTSAGVAASLDCCLHVVRSDFGVNAATTLARHLVMAPHREGNQAQYLATPVIVGDQADPIEQAMVWARTHLAEPIDLDRWSRQVTLSRRTFSRRFRDRAGLSCQDWLTGQRLDHARLLLETTDHPIDRIAAAAGFGSAQALRHHFRQRLDTTPAQHRRAFSRRDSPAGDRPANAEHQPGVQ